MFLFVYQAARDHLLFFSAVNVFTSLASALPPADNMHPSGWSSWFFQLGCNPSFLNLFPILIQFFEAPKISITFHLVLLNSITILNNLGYIHAPELPKLEQYYLKDYPRLPKNPLTVTCAI